MCKQFSFYLRADYHHLCLCAVGNHKAINQESDLLQIQGDKK